MSAHLSPLSMGLAILCMQAFAAAPPASGPPASEPPASEPQASLSQELTLAECVEKALKGYPAIRSAQAEVAAREQEQIQSRSSFFPKVRASMGADLWRRSPGQPLEGVFPGTDLEPTTSLSASWEVLGVRTPLEYQHARIRREQALGSLSDARRALESGVVRIYYDLLEAQQVLRLQVKLRDLSGEEKDLQERKVQEGSSSPLHGIDSELALLGEERELARAEADLIRAAAELSLLVGETVEPLRRLEELALDVPQDAGDLELWLAAAKRQRGDLAARRASVAAAEKNASIAFWERLPTVSVGAQYALNPDPFYGVGAKPFEARFLDTEATWTFGVGVDLPLFTGGNLRARHNHARILESQAHYGLELTMREVERDVRQAWARFRAARESLRIRVREVALKSESVKVIGRLYRAGARYHRVDWQRSQTELARKEVDLVRARVEARESWVQLLRSAGLPLTAEGPGEYVQDAKGGNS